MNLRHLSDDELLRQTETAASSVRTATTRLLHHLHEVQRRRLYAKIGYDSLFEYCVKALRMSEPQAARRVNAARVLTELPHLEQKISDGSLSLTAVSQAHTFFKKEALAGNVMSSATKAELFEKLQSRPTREVERFLMSQASQPVQYLREKIRPITQAVSEIKFAADESTLNDLRFLREFWMAELPGATFGDLIKKMARFCREEISQRDIATPAPESAGAAKATAPRRSTRQKSGRGKAKTRTANPVSAPGKAENPVAASHSVLRFVSPSDR